MGHLDWQQKDIQNFKNAIQEKLGQNQFEKWWQTKKEPESDRIKSIHSLVVQQAWKSVWPSSQRYIFKLVPTIYLWDAT
jgi:hypothetical protein